ncbi:UNVERIFIED_CONTAM: hypothetical protein FKN15_009516 [Acipenser sinensis]
MAHASEDSVCSTSPLPSQRRGGSDTDPRVLEKQELQQPTYVALSYINSEKGKNQ